MWCGVSVVIRVVLPAGCTVTVVSAALSSAASHAAALGVWLRPIFTASDMSSHAGTATALDTNGQFCRQSCMVSRGQLNSVVVSCRR